MKYNIVKILSSAACVFVFFEDCYGMKSCVFTKLSQEMDTEQTEDKCQHKLYFGIFKEPPQEIAKKIQEMREQEKQQKAEQLTKSNSRNNFSPTIQQIELPE